MYNYANTPSLRDLLYLITWTLGSFSWLGGVTNNNRKQKKSIQFIPVWQRSIHTFIGVNNRNYQTRIGTSLVRLSASSQHFLSHFTCETNTRSFTQKIITSNHKSCWCHQAMWPERSYMPTEIKTKTFLFYQNNKTVLVQRTKLKFYHEKIIKVEGNKINKSGTNSS